MDKPNPLKMWESERKESDRGYALVALDFIDSHLSELLKASMVDDVPRVKSILNSPIRAIATRAKLAYCLGLIGEQTYELIEQIREIRNQFGHSFELLTFDSPDIAAMCKQIRIPEYDEKGVDNRFRFELAVNELWQHLAKLTRNAERRSIPKDHFDVLRMDEPQLTTELQRLNAPRKRALGFPDD
jgi:DNA-binding MltR family transcriptional regulator